MTETIDEAALAGEPERTMTDYSFSWEGEQETVTDLGDALVRAIPVRWSGVNGMVVRQSYDPATVDQRLDEVMAQIEGNDGRFLWIVGPSSQPADLGERFEARGLRPAVVWDGMVQAPLEPQILGNPDVLVEPLNEENAEAFATIRSDGFPDPAIKAERLASAHRYLQNPDKQSLIYVASLDGQAAGYVILRIEPNGVAYFRDAYTLPAFRQHGVYLSLVAKRLQVAHEAGCTAATVQANQKTSSPILQKRGFRPVSRIVGYARVDPTSSGW
jgi:GNAT superfamily N-acetyltransferase